MALLSSACSEAEAVGAASRLRGHVVSAGTAETGAVGAGGGFSGATKQVRRLARSACLAMVTELSSNRFKSSFVPVHTDGQTDSQTTECQ